MSAQLEVGASKTDGFVVRVSGRGGIVTSSALTTLVETFPVQQPLTVDLGACPHIDSTFIGGLVRIHKRYLKGDGHFTLVPHPDNRHVLHVMKLDSFFSLADAAPDMVSVHVIPIADQMDRDELGAFVRACHQSLLEVSGPHVALCEDVIKRLDEELPRGH